MNKKSIITMMLALVTMAGQAQTKTATITGYSPALKEGTLVIGCAGTSWEIVDSVRAGHYSLTVPVEELSVGGMSCIGEGLPNFYFKPDAEAWSDGDSIGHRLPLSSMESRKPDS